MAEGQARIATNFNQREVEEIAERIQPNTGGLPNTDVFIRSTWLVIYARLVGILVGLFSLFGC